MNVAAEQGAHGIGSCYVSLGYVAGGHCRGGGQDGHDIPDRCEDDGDNNELADLLGRDVDLFRGLGDDVEPDEEERNHHQDCEVAVHAAREEGLHVRG